MRLWGKTVHTSKTLLTFEVLTITTTVATSLYVYGLECDWCLNFPTQSSDS